MTQRVLETSSVSNKYRATIAGSHGWFKYHITYQHAVRMKDGTILGWGEYSEISNYARTPKKAHDKAMKRMNRWVRQDNAEHAAIEAWDDVFSQHQKGQP